MHFWGVGLPFVWHLQSLYLTKNKGVRYVGCKDHDAIGH